MLHIKPIPIVESHSKIDFSGADAGNGECLWLGLVRGLGQLEIQVGNRRDQRRLCGCGQDAR